MAIRTPYCSSILDLSNKVENTSVPPKKNQRMLAYGYVPTENPSVCSSYPNPRPGNTGPAAPVSPSISKGSNSPGDDAHTTHAAPYNLFRPYALGLPSPPESLPSATPQQTVMDVDSLSDDPDFQEFASKATEVMAEKNGGSLIGNNPKMRRTVSSNNQNATNDSYLEQRKKNNRAAKQSRDRRKLREIRQMLKVSYLKKEVAKLKTQLASGPCSRCNQV